MARNSDTRNNDEATHENLDTIQSEPPDVGCHGSWWPDAAFRHGVPLTLLSVLAIVWMVQHAGFPGEGGKAQDVFKNWALEHFGK